MKRFAVVLAVALPQACAPSREASFDVTRVEVQERTGQRARWYQDDPLEREIDDAVKQLLERELTPDSAAQIALLNNRALQARFEEIGVARANLVQATLFANPSISGEVLFPITADETQLGVGIELDFLSTVFRPARRDLALAQLGATQLEVAGAAIDLAFEARAALLQYVRARQLADVLAASVETSALAHEVSQRLHAAGNITDLAFMRQRIAVESARLALSTQERESIRARERLIRDLGLDGLEPEAKVASRVPLLPDDLDVVPRFERRAMARSLVLEVGRRRAEVAARALGVTDLQRFLPAVSLGASAEREDEGYLAGPSLAVSLPVFDQGQGAVATREAELRRLLEGYTATVVEVRSEARRVRDELRMAHERARLLRDVVVPLRAKLLQEALLQYNAMSIGIFDLLDVKRMQLETELQQTNALADYWLLRLAYEQLLAGRLPAFEVDAGTVSLESESSGLEAPGLAGDDD